MTHLSKLFQEYKPSKALILYTSKENNNYLEVVDIINNKLTNPVPASLELIGKMIEYIEYEKQNKSIYYKGIIPKDLISFNCTETEINLIYKIKPSKYKLLFRKGLFNNYTINLPGLIFHYNENKLKVYTYFNYKEENTILYRTPLLNINDSCNVCMGNASIKDWKEFDNINEFIEHINFQFWNSEFSEIHGKPCKIDYEEFLESSINKVISSKHLFKLNFKLNDLYS